MAELKPRKISEGVSGVSERTLGSPGQRFIGSSSRTDDDRVGSRDDGNNRALALGGDSEAGGCPQARIKSALIAIDEPEVHEKGKALLELL